MIGAKLSIVAMVSVLATWFGPATAQSDTPKGTADTLKDPASGTTGTGPRDQVVASFEGGHVTVGDLLDTVASKAPSEQLQLAELKHREAMLHAMVDYDLLVLEAQRRGYETHPAVHHRLVKASVDAMTQIDLAANPASISKQDVEARYEARRHTFERGRQRRASLIVVATRTEATKLIEQLRGRGRQAFSRAAREHSVDKATRPAGGQLGFFDQQGRRTPSGTKWQIPEAVVAAVFATKVGEIGQAPFRHGGGHGLVAVTAETAAHNQSLEDVEAMLREALAEEAQAAAIAALAERLTAEHTPRAHLELLDAIKLDPAPAQDAPSGTSPAPQDPRKPARHLEPDGV